MHLPLGNDCQETEMASAEDSSHLAVTSRQTSEETDETNLLTQYKEKFSTTCPKDDSSKNEVPWRKGDIALEYINSINSSGTPTSEDTLLKSFAESVGENVSSFRVYVWVSRAFPSESMRNTGLSWSCYRSAAGAKDAEGSKDPMYWIRIAAEENLSTRGLDKRIAEAMNKTELCAQCKESLLIKSKLKLYEDDKQVKHFCCYKCLAKYALDAT